MALTPQISVWDLWSESARTADSLGDPLFLECMEAANSNKIFDDLTDDQLKTTLSIINSMLNDPKSKPKGLTLFNDFVTQINPSRLIGFQDAVISSLHLVLKGLDSSLASRALSNFLVKCHHMSEVNQVVTSTTVPKVLSYFVEESQESITQRSSEEIALLKVCLTEYHGPCGHFRDKLEKILVSLLDTENNELIQQLSEVMPLLSYAGGGGPAGDKHTKDWTAMISKFLMTTYSTLNQLYGDNFRTLEPDTIFDGEQLAGLKRIVESQVLLRLSLLKRRLQNLLTVISGYLRFPFPAPKFIPQKTILELIAVLPPNITRTVNEASKLKEHVFLTAMVPGIHVMALNLLRGLLLSVGSNIFTCATTVEQIVDSEFKWLSYKPRAFEKLKYELYNTLTDWLTLTGGTVTNLKTSSLWVNAIGVDTRVEKEVVELKMSKPTPGKSVKLMSTASMTLSSGKATQVFVEKNAELSQAALTTLTFLIPALDSDNHRKVYEHLVKTAAIISQFQCPPSPYKNPECRKLIYQNLSKLCESPHPKSPVSVALAVTLLRNGKNDPTSLVSALCANQLFERLLHPISAPLSLAGPSPHPVALDNSNIMHFTNRDTEMEEVPEDTQNQNSSPQNISPGDPNVVSTCLDTCVQAVSVALSQEMVFSNLKEKAEKILRDGLTLNSIPSNFSDVQNTQTSFTMASSEDPINLVNRNIQTYLVAHINLQNGLPSEDDHEIVQLGSSVENDDCVIVGESIPHLNGNSSHIENGLPTQEEDMAEFSLCNNGTPHEVSEMEIVENSKTISPTKSVPGTPFEKVDGPSVEDMLSSFVDVQPATWL